ncbi:MAG: hypothetical protein ACHQFW_09555 [Chitinophagales bacterium]
MKSPSSDLFTLVKSLSKSEKRYFKLHASRHYGGKNQYVKLFQFIEKQPEYDEKVLLKEFSSTKSIAHFAVIKKQLYENILESLHRFDEFAHSEQKIYKGIHYCSLLLKKGLFDQCKKQIKKYRVLAYTLEKFECIIELIEIEKQLITKTQFTTVSYAQMEALQEEQYACIKNLDTTGNFWIKSNTIFKMHYEKKIAPGKENNELNKLMDDDEFKSENKATTFKSKLDRLQINALHAFVNGDVAKAYQLNAGFIRMVDEHKHFKLLFADRYFSVLNNYLIDSLILNKNKELISGIKLMRSLPGLPEFKHIQNLEANVFRLSFLLEMNLYVSGEDFEKALRCMEDIQKGLAKYRDKIPKPNIITLRYLSAYTLFCTKRFNECLSELLIIMNMKEAESIADIYRDTRMLELICHFELGDHFLLESQIISFQRLLITKKIRSRTLKIVIRFLKQSTQKLSKPKSKDLEKELLILSENEEEKIVFNNLNYLYWARELRIAD